MRAISYEGKRAEEKAVRQEYEPKRKEKDAEKAAKLLEGGAYFFESRDGFRLELTRDQHLERHIERDYIQREEKYIEEDRREIVEKLNKSSLEEIIQTHPELAEKIESFKLDKEGMEMSLLREKETPEIAILVCSGEQSQNGSTGLLGETVAALNISEPNLPEQIIQEKFPAVCADCPAERYGQKSPFLSNYPIRVRSVQIGLGTIQDNVSEFGISHDNTRHLSREEMDKEMSQRSADINRAHLELYHARNRRDELFVEDCRIWDKSEDGQKNQEWNEQKKREYKKAVQESCTKNGVRYLILRKAEKWAENYGALDGVTMVEITDSDEVNRIVKSLKPEGQQTEKIPSIPSIEIGN